MNLKMRREQTAHVTITTRATIHATLFRRLLPVAALALIGTAALPVTVWACDACNLAFTDEVLAERSDTLLARDVRIAMANQRGLPLDGMTSAVVAQHVENNERLANAPREADAEGESTDEPDTMDSAAAEQGPEESADEPQGPSMPPNAGMSSRPMFLGQPLPEYFQGDDFIEIIERDYAAPLPPTSYVPQDTTPDKSVTIRLNEGRTYIGNGVIYDGFLTDGKIPGPTIIVEEGDVVEFIIENRGIVPHGASIHAAYTQTSKYVGKIDPGQTKKVLFRANHPGVYMYHCAPGGHAIPMHVLFGQYGMMVVRPKQEKYQLEKDLGQPPDLELFLIQHEFYTSGNAAISGDPAYTVFNGRLFRYVEEPIKAKPGDFVRIYFINLGPNLLSTFHIVGIIWDYAYWQGNPEAMFKGGQTVTAGPSDSWVVEFRVPPDEGAYTLLSHAVGSTSRGAIGLLVADRNAETASQVLADGPSFTAEEMAEIEDKATRVISPFAVGTHPDDEPVIYGPEVQEVTVKIIGNSFHPKVVQIAPGTTVRWINEDAFTYLAGEYSGIHNVASTNPPEGNDGFVAPLLAHGESYRHTFDAIEWSYDYICTPHPYMKGRVIVKEPEYRLSDASKTNANAGAVSLGGWLLPLLALSILLSTIALIFGLRRTA